MVPPDAPEKKRLATCGRPMPGVEVRIVDPETLDDVAAGEKGEILFRGGGAFMGYYKDDSATEATVLSEGWIRTGDLFHPKKVRYQAALHPVKAYFGKLQA